jgi:hypothetical protein
VGVFDVQFALGGKDANAPIANLKVFLQGPHNPNVAAAMFTTLNSAGQLPLTQPYKNDLYNGTPLDYDGNETVSVMPANIVDWVLVELRTGTAANTKIAMQAALLRDDGVVVDAGGGTVAFNNVVWDNYYLVVRHRNHIPIISFTGVPLTNASAQWDFTAAAGLALGSTQIELSAGLFGMYGGDANLDGSVAYVGAARDQLGVINLLGTENLSDLQTNLYNNSDMNLNNEIRYIGNGRDQSVIITALGTDNLGDVITSAVPE